MNHTILTGNLTGNVEIKDVGDAQVSRFTLASNQGERVIFLPVEAWNMPHLAEFLHKGSRVAVSGSLRQDHWETDKGEKRQRIYLTAFQVEFLDPPARVDEKQKSQPGNGAPRGKNNYRPSNQRRERAA